MKSLISLFLYAAQAFSLQAQEAAKPAQSPFASMVPMILIFMVIYFLMIRPQKKKAKDEEDFLEKLGSGDEVYTKFGILGTVAALSGRFVTLQVEDGTKFKMLKSQIAGLSKSLFEKEKSSKEENKKKIAAAATTRKKSTKKS